MKPGDLLLYGDDSFHVTWPKIVRPNPDPLHPTSGTVEKLYVGQVSILLGVVDTDRGVPWSTLRTLKIMTQGGRCGYVKESYMRVIET